MKKTLFLFLVAVGLAGCTAGIPQPTAEPAGFEISPAIDVIFINESVDFLLVDIETGEPVERPGWSITSPHNVPGDRGVMRSDGRFTAPRLDPDPPTVRIRANLGGRQVFAEFQARDPARPDPEATGRPGDSHLHPVFGTPPEIRTSRPIDSGLRTGESVAITAFDRTGRPLVVHYHEVKHKDRVVDYAGTITTDGVYTAPSVVPDPPTVRIHIRYLREGAKPGDISLLGIPIRIVP